MQAARPSSVEPGTDTTRSDDLADIQRALQADQHAAQRSEPAHTAHTEPAAREFASPARVLASFNPDLSFIADFALAAFSRKSQQTGGHDPVANGFNLQALELAVRADVDPYFRFQANLVFGAEGVEVEEVYATTLSLPANLQVRAGNMLTRFGRINPTHPHSWDFVDQPLVIGKMLGADGNHGLGTEVSWLSPLPWYAEVVVSETMATGACCARSFYGDDDKGVHAIGDFQTTVALKQFFALSDDWSLAPGLSAALGPNSSYAGARTQVYGTDWYLKYRPISYQSFTIVSLQAEALLRRRDTLEGVLQDGGLYAQAFWRFAQRWATAARYELVTGVRNDPLDPAWTSDRWRVAANLSFYPTEFSRLRLQASRDYPTWDGEPIDAAFLALEVVAGTHGAHSF